MNVKAKGLRALKKAKDCQNFWLLLNHWKQREILPPQFGVYVCGPPKTGKTRLVERFKKLWPDCIAIESPQRALTALERVNVAGYDLVLQTGRGVNQQANGLTVDWLFVTIEKCRYFGTLTDRVVATGGRIPHTYDLTPFWSINASSRHA